MDEADCLSLLPNEASSEAPPAREHKRKFIPQPTSSDEEYVQPTPVKTTRVYAAKKQKKKAPMESTAGSQSTVEVGEQRVGKADKGKAPLHPAKPEDKRKQEVPLSQQPFKPLYEAHPLDIELHEHKLVHKNQWGPHDTARWTLEDVPAFDLPVHTNPPSPW